MKVKFSRTVNKIIDGHQFFNKINTCLDIPRVGIGQGISKERAFISGD